MPRESLTPESFVPEPPDKDRFAYAYARMQARDGSKYLLDANKRGERTKTMARDAAVAGTIPAVVGMLPAVYEAGEWGEKRKTDIPMEAILQRFNRDGTRGSRTAEEARTDRHVLQTGLSSVDDDVRRDARETLRYLRMTADAEGIKVDKLPLREYGRYFASHGKNVAKGVVPLAALGALGGYFQHNARLKKRKKLLEEVAAHEKSAETKMELSQETVDSFWQEVEAIKVARDASSPAVEETEQEKLAALWGGFSNELEKMGHEKVAIMGFLKKLMGGAGGEVAGATSHAAQSQAARSRLAAATTPTFENTRAQRPGITLGGKKPATPAPAPVPHDPKSLNSPAAEAARAKAGGAAAVQAKVRERMAGEVTNPGGRVDFGNKERYGTFSAGRS